MLTPKLMLHYIYTTARRAKIITQLIANTDDAAMLEYRREAELRLIGWKIIEAIDAGYTISIDYKGSDPLKVSEYTDSEVAEAVLFSIQQDNEGVNI